ncbi:tRNA (adenosine(37)-N6)-dimethylallyltransferase MiaA [Verrucomicrobiota bacterium sgz303538]
MNSPSESSEARLTGPFYLVGPTAVGKTELAVEVAERLDAEIVGCDAFQVYDGLAQLTAKPAPELLKRVPHHLVGEIPLSQPFDVGQYRQLALERIAATEARGKQALVVGGTGLYLRAMTRGLADVPPADPELRQQFEGIPLQELQERLRLLDPVGYGQIDLQNPRRVIRALEVSILAGQPFSSFQEEWNEIPGNLRGVSLERDRDELYARINLRVEQMFESGALEEVGKAGEIGSTAAQTLGLRETRAVLQGQMTISECIATIQNATRRYAKRQMTWFRREIWLKKVNLSEIPSPSEQADAVFAALTAPH